MIDFSVKNSPFLSHHCAVSLHERYIMLIGGWNGRVRLSDVFVYDTAEEKWIQVRTQGFNAGAGLSSHAAVVLSNNDILVIGREGGLRMQRRSGNAFLLRGDMKSRSFTYTEQAMGVSSRSGHTAHILLSRLVIYGGRGDKAIEIHDGYRSSSSQHHRSASFVDKLVAKKEDLKTVTKPPCGRKHHIAVAGREALLIHGGETFDGKSREPVGEVFLLTFKPHMSWYKVDVIAGRAGHVGIAYGDSLIIHGGEEGRSSVSSSTLKIDL